MFLDEQHELNKWALEYILRGRKQPGALPIAAPDSVMQPYMEQGSHPDVVERVWEGIGSALPQDCRCLVYGTPALVHPESGILLVFCNGTTYCIQLTAQLVDKALKTGAKTYTQWTSGSDMDTQRDLGLAWVFGRWLEDELQWCREVYQALGKPD